MRDNIANTANSAALEAIMPTYIARAGTRQLIELYWCEVASYFGGMGWDWNGIIRLFQYALCGAALMSIQKFYLVQKMAWDSHNWFILHSCYISYIGLQFFSQYKSRLLVITTFLPYVCLFTRVSAYYSVRADHFRFHYLNIVM